MPQPESNAELWQELRPVLDQEMSRLPDKFRFVLIACDLEGKTRKTVADLLGVPEGTVASRLARARALLAKRLQRHRVIVSPGLLATLLTQRAPAPSMPEALVVSTARLASDGASSGVAALAESVVQAMFWTKLKIAAALVCVVAFLGLAILPWLPSASAERNTESVKKEKPVRFSECIVRKLDPENRILQAEHEAAALHLQVEPDTKITVAGRDAKFADLQAGMIVHVDSRRGPDGQQHALRIEAIGQTVSGSIQRTNDGAVTIHAEGMNQEDTYLVEPAANIIIDGKTSKLGDLKTRMKVKLRFVAGKPAVVRIEAVGPKVEGVVKSLDAKKRSLSMDLADLHLAAEGIAVAADAVVKIDGKQGQLSDVKTGMRVTLQMSAQTEPSRVVGILSAARKP